MSPQRFSIPRVNMERVRPWLPIAGSAVGGLILGLLIGWWLWPVEWTNAQLPDLTQEQKAVYLSAVADAYALDGTQAPEAPLGERLAAFGETIADEIVAAMEYYQSQPNPDAVKLANLGQLASAVGVPVDATMMAATDGAGVQAEAPPEAEVAVDAAAAEVAPAAESAQAVDAADEEGSGTGILTWLVVLLLSVLLIGGGAYLLLRISRPRQPSPSMVEPPAPVLPGEPRPVQPVYTTTTTDKGSGARTAAWSPEKSQPVAAAPTADDLAFDDEVEDDPSSRYQRTTGAVIAVDDDEPATPRYTSQAAQTAWSPVSTVESRTSAYASQPASAGVAVAEPPAAYAGVAAIATLDAGAGSAPTITAPRPQPKPPARKFISKYTCEYFSGAPDYIEAHSIVDPLTNKFVGECGMSVSKKNRTLHESADEVIALEVWLYDKLDPKENASNTRVLLSRYAADHDLAQSFAQGNDVSKVVVVKPGAKFQVDGRNLVLEGEILHVEYDREGVFRDVRLAMNILSRK